MNAGVELQAVGRATRDDDVVARLEGKRAEDAVQHAGALMDKENLVRRGIAIQLCLWFGRAATGHDHIVVDQQRNPPGNRRPVGLHVPRLQVMMAENGLVDYVYGRHAGRLNFAHACWGSKMVANAVSAAEAARRHDFLVKDALAPKSGKVPMGHVPLTWNRAEF